MHLSAQSVHMLANRHHQYLCQAGTEKRQINLNACGSTRNMQTKKYEWFTISPAYTDHGVTANTYLRVQNGPGSTCCSTLAHPPQ